MPNNKKGTTRATGKHIQPSTPPPPKMNDRKEGWWSKLAHSRTFLEAITVTLLIGVFTVILGILYDRWTDEIGDRIKAEERERNRIAENDRLRQEVENLRKKNEEFERLNPFLQLYEYGTRAKLVASYDLKKEVGAQLVIGNCTNVPCSIFRIDAIPKDSAKDSTGRRAAVVSLTGAWEGITGTSSSNVFPIFFKKGCMTSLSVSRYDVDFVIEDDWYSSMKAGIGISIASSIQEGKGIRLRSIQCPEGFP